MNKLNNDVSKEEKCDKFDKSNNEFSKEEKCAIFDKLYNQYFDKNFGTMSKLDFETLLFSEFIDHRMKNNLAFDDYTLSKTLGITQNRIRSLSERKELKYPNNNLKWKEVFIKAIPNAKYDDHNKRIKLIIQDINVMIEIRHYLETIGWYDEYQSNKKILQVPIDCFLDICESFESQNNIFTEETKKSIQKIRKEAKIYNSAFEEFLIDFSKDGLKNFAKNAPKEALSLVLKQLPLNGLTKRAIESFLNIID